MPGLSPQHRTGVAIVTFNSAQDIEACLISLVSGQVDKIVVLDNGSSRDHAVRTKEICATFSQVTLLSSDANLGFGAGVNAAVSALAPSLSDQDFIWIVNPDTVVENSAAKHLGSAISAGCFDIVSPRVTTGPVEGPRIVWFGGGSLDLRAMRTVHHDLGKAVTISSEEFDCTFLTGAALFMRLGTWRELGGFSEDYFLYWEDADLSYRAAKSGLTLGVVSSSSVWHSVGGSGDRSGKSATYYYYMQRNRALFARKLKLGRRLVWGPGFAESIRLTLRPLKQPVNPLSKFWSGLRGLVAGMKPLALTSGKGDK